MYIILCLYNIVSSHKSENTHEDEACRDDAPEIFNLDMALKEFKTAKDYNFIYLIYAVSRESKYFTPYSFKIVNFEDINENCFFTLSTKGILSNIKNQVTFTSLKKFEEEYDIYKQIVKVGYSLFI